MAHWRRSATIYSCGRPPRCSSCFVLRAAESGYQRGAGVDDAGGGAQLVAHRRGVPAEPAASPAVSGDSALAGRRDARAAADEYVRGAGALYPGVRADRRAPCSMICFMPTRSTRIRCLSSVTCGGLRSPVTITRCPRRRGSCSSCRSPRWLTWRRCFMTSPRGAAGITRSWEAWMPRHSVSSRASPLTTRGWWRGWYAIIWNFPLLRRSRTSAIRR